jgi:hypothetical protein
VFVGVKMLITYFEMEIPIAVSLGVVGGILGLSVAASLLFPKSAAAHTPVPHEHTAVLAPREDEGPSRTPRAD